MQYGRDGVPTYGFHSRGELQGALADGFADRLVGRDGGEPGGLRLALVAQEVNQTQSLTLGTQLRRPRSCVPYLRCHVTTRSSGSL